MHITLYPIEMIEINQCKALWVGFHKSVWFLFAHETCSEGRFENDHELSNSSARKCSFFVWNTQLSCVGKIFRKSFWNGPVIFYVIV